MSTFGYFRTSLVFTFFMLVLAGVVGWIYNGTASGVATAIFLATVLSVLEISLSFDNAVVNAKVLEHMTPLWRHRFLTWGIAIAVFGMRIIFPLVIVGVVAQLGPLEVIRLAALNPNQYAQILTSAHHLIAAFGGAFLAMVGLKFFFDHEKEIHWIRIIESPLSKMGRIEAVELAIVMATLYGISKFLPDLQRAEFLAAGIFGLIVYVLIDGVTMFMEEGGEEALKAAHRASASLFIYLELLDASFSFDGVIGAFALTNNLFIIAAGLGAGAMFVRSITIMLVDKGTLATYRFLEHGAFYAIGSLAAIMFLGTLIHIPEAITGFIGAGFIGLSFWSSIRHNRLREGKPVAPA